MKQTRAPRPFDAVLDETLSPHPASNALVVGGRWPGHPPPAPLREIETLDDAVGADLGRVDVALLFARDASGPCTTFDRLLARLRDLHAARLWVAVPASGKPDAAAAWNDHLRALGLEALARVEHDGRTFDLFRFDLASYKRTPDWLNPKHWANPELWNRYRW